MRSRVATLDLLVADAPTVAGIIAIPLFWIIINYIYGYYRDTLRKSGGDLEAMPLLITVALCFHYTLFVLILMTLIKYTSYYISFTTQCFSGLQFS
ncbi:MAG: hypothetical protein R2744_07955 [Bacteroidales bacterium]